MYNKDNIVGVKFTSSGNTYRVYNIRDGYVDLEKLNQKNERIQDFSRNCTTEECVRYINNNTWKPITPPIEPIFTPLIFN